MNISQGKGKETRTSKICCNYKAHTCFLPFLSAKVESKAEVPCISMLPWYHRGLITHARLFLDNASQGPYSFDVHLYNIKHTHNRVKKRKTKSGAKDTQREKKSSAE
jgi:hypothetical protein